MVPSACILSSDILAFMYCGRSSVMFSAVHTRSLPGILIIDGCTFRSNTSMALLLSDPEMKDRVH